VDGFNIHFGYCCRSGQQYSKHISKSFKSFHVIKGTKTVGQRSQVRRKFGSKCLTTGYDIADSGARRKFSWGVSFSGTWWLFVFSVRCLWRHNLTSYSCFQTNVLAKFLDIICTLFYTHSPKFMHHWTEYKLSALQVRISEENTLKATTQQFITVKISGCVLKQWSKTYSSLPPSNLKLQNEAPLMSWWIRAVEHRKCMAGLPDPPWFARSNLAKLHNNWECA